MEILLILLQIILKLTLRLPWWIQHTYTLAMEQHGWEIECDIAINIK